MEPVVSLITRLRQKTASPGYPHDTVATSGVAPAFIPGWKPVFSAKPDKMCHAQTEFIFNSSTRSYPTISQAPLFQIQVPNKVTVDFGIILFRS